MNRLKDLRTDMDLTQDELGERVGMSGMVISYYEREKRGMKPSDIDVFCDFFGVTSDYFLCRSNVPTPRVSKLDTDLLLAYHAAPLEIQKIVNAALEAYKPAEAEGKEGVSA